MPGWLDDLRARRDAPLLERLRFLDSLALDPALTAAAASEAVGDDDDDLRWICDGLARRIPAERRLSILAELDEDHHVVAQALRAALGARVVDAALAVLEGASGDCVQAVAELLACWHEVADVGVRVAAHARRLVELAGAEDRQVRSLACVLALRCRAFAPPVLRGLERMLAEAADVESDGYDERVAVEELLGDIARGGAALQSLAPGLIPLFRDDGMDVRAAATLAAIGIGAAELVSEIEAAYRRLPAGRGLAQNIERALLAYALWRFDGPPERFTEAAELAGDSIVVQHRLRCAFEVSAVDGRLLTALREIAQDECWAAQVFSVFAGFGPPAAEFVKTLEAPDPEDEAFVPYVEARWRCGLDDAQAARAALERKLAWKAWDLYMQLGPDPERVRTAIAEAPPAHPQPVTEALVGHPRVGVQFVRELLQFGHTWAVERIWRALPTDEFWRAVG